jgi:hypothetical protein
MEDTENEKNIFVWNSKARGNFGTDIMNGRIILKMDPREAFCVDMKWVEVAHIEFSNSYFQAVIHINTKPLFNTDSLQVCLLQLYVFVLHRYKENHFHCLDVTLFIF